MKIRVYFNRPEYEIQENVNKLKSLPFIKTDLDEYGEDFSLEATSLEMFDLCVDKLEKAFERKFDLVISPDPLEIYIGA